jgi:chemotaxis protein MotB
MIQRVLFFAAVAATLYSCGSGKKLEAANAQITQLQANNRMLQKNVDDAKQQVTDLQSSNSSLTDQLSGCKRTVQQQDARIKNAQAVIQEEREKMKKIQEKIDAALTDFESKGVSVFSKDGVVYVEMTDKLLYRSGSSMLSDSGKQALTNLATALNGYPNLGIIVMGNTDDVKFKKGGGDNWTLSTERANGVVRVLRDASVDPGRITAAGRGKYNPVADNSTAEGRAKNRRTDIILNPDIAKVWASMDEK